MTQIHALRMAWLWLFALYACGMPSLALLCRLAFPNRSRAKPVMARALLFIGMLGLGWFALEFGFAFLAAQSDGFGLTFASKLWFDRHWKPINEYGYRDLDGKNFSGKSVIYVVGDSFVAGHGIDRIEDRFADRLARRLGTGWEHAVIASNGWQTPDEFKAMQDYPAKPDVVVLSYYINDIQTAAERLHHPPRYFSEPGRLAQALIYRSFVLNYAYWKFYRGSMGNDYYDYLQSCYADKGIWEAHARELQQIIDWTRQGRIHLCVVVWPALADVDRSAPMTSKVADYLNLQHVLTIDLTGKYRHADPKALVVNSLDGHPNKAVHHEVAELLYDTLVKAGFVSH